MEAVDHNYDPKTFDAKKDKLSIYPVYYVKPQNVERDLTLRGSIDYLSALRIEPNNRKLLISRPNTLLSISSNYS